MGRATADSLTRRYSKLPLRQPTKDAGTAAAIAELAKQQREADSKSIETCDCPACSLERDVKAAFPGAQVEIIFMGEDTGRTD